MMTAARKIKARHDWRMPHEALKLAASGQKIDAIWKGSRPQHYILKGRKPVPVGFERMMRWAREKNKSGRITVPIALERVGIYTISTIFLGMDHGYMGPPVLFETMAWVTKGGKFRDEQYRYRTWEEAMTGHKQYARRLRMQLVTKK